MIIVGLTGGIGSGKTTVAKAFEALGIPTYIADEEAKKLMNRSKIIKRKLVNLFGEKAYLDNKLNRPYIADIIFNNNSYLEQINAIVHPKVQQHFNRWIKKQTSPYVLKESAILFENGAYKSCNYIITVTAPKELRIQRLLKRDKTSLDKIESIMNNQWSDQEKTAKSHYVIENKNLQDLKPQVSKIHQQILDNLG